ncbi:MAG: O-antigen ligase family protein [Bacteroidia bacterium]|nr:O-antigen ligase family protein [Bacteroidia bacterium]NNF31519.1 O-antigen ligase family protein [Flavobacteriaceae bacterium]MBT8275594.1 O-antigen ligase family protein [Bacteroidia bacterium]NNJ82784.1 O-antigen ligase family protein [Flavobacteriaceae bacterium]NNK54098.1 O-antigen ligase family protein [Flavobacteriaceae bacterium]
MQRISKIVSSPQAYWVLLSALLISLPLPYGFSTGILIALLASSLLSARYHKLSFQKIYLVPILFYVLMVCSLFWTSSVENSLRGLERQLAMVLIPAAFFLMPELSIKIRDKIFYAFAVALTMFAIFFIGAAFIEYLENSNINRFFYHALVSPLELNAIYLSVMVSLSGLFLLFNQPKSLTTILLLLIHAIFLILLASKVIIVITALVAVFGIVRTFKRSRILLLLPVLLIGVILLMVTSNPVRERFEREFTVSDVKEVMECERFDKVYDWTGTTIRLFQARIFVEMLDEDSAYLTGYGINNSKHKIIEKQKQYNLWQGYYEYNFHNQYIQAFAELGIFGFIFLLILLGSIFKEYLRTKDMLFLSLFLVMLVVFLTESYIWRQRGLYHFLVFFCLLFKVSAIPSKSGTES